MSSETLAAESDLIDLSWIFEEITIRHGAHADRSRIRRAVDESLRYVGELQEWSWCRWAVETAHSLGFVSREIDAELDELIRLARDGAIIVLRSADGKSWRALAENSSRTIRLYQPRCRLPVQRIRLRAARSQLNADGFQGLLRCVIIEPATVDSHDGTHDKDAHSTPTGRLFSLMRAEWSDLRVVVIFALVSGVLSMTTPLAVEALVSTVAFGRVVQPVLVLSMMLLAFLLFKAAMKAMQTWVVEIIQRRLFARLAAELSWRLPRARIDAFHGSYPPELVNRFFDVVTVQKTAAGLLLDGVSLILSMVVGMTVLAFYHPWLLAFDLVLILLMAFVFLLGRGALKSSIRESKCKYAMAAWLQDLARCRTTFRYDGAAEFALERSDQLIFNYLSARTKHFSVLMRQLLAILLIQAIASTGLLTIGGWLVITGQLSLGQLVAAELIVAIVVDSFAKMSKHIESFYDLLASVDKIGHLLDLEVERADGLLTLPSGSGIMARNICFRSDAHATELRPVSFEMRPGERIALTDDGTGAGSLVLDILFGLREPDSGMISLNGIDPRDLRPDVLRRRVVLVRDVEVFDGTIAENVHLERTEVSLGDVRNALEVSGLMLQVQALPDGLNTMLSATGAPFTSSQCRRLMLARAIAGHPEIVLIDELLDAFSEESSEEILRRIISADHAWTIVVLTSRRHLRKLMGRELSISAGNVSVAASP
ncbi:MAG: ATP-binding cassette domain-containing protein [Planctomycetia bacterium]